MILALLCAVVQGAWAQNYDVWDGHSTERPISTSNRRVLRITKAAHLAYVRDHWDDVASRFWDEVSWEYDYKGQWR